MCRQCEVYRAALEKIATPIAMANSIDPQQDAIIAFVSQKVGIAMEALKDGVRNKEKI